MMIDNHRRCFFRNSRTKDRLAVFALVSLILSTTVRALHAFLPSHIIKTENSIFLPIAQLANRSSIVKKTTWTMDRETICS